MCSRRVWGPIRKPLAFVLLPTGMFADISALSSISRPRINRKRQSSPNNHEQMSDKCQCIECMGYTMHRKVFCYVCNRYVFHTCARDVNIPDRGFKAVCSACILQHYPNTYDANKWNSCCVPCACGCETIGIKESCYDCGHRFQLLCIQKAIVGLRWCFICYQCTVKCTVKSALNQPESDWLSCCRREWSPMFPLFRLFFEEMPNKHQKTYI